MPDPSTPTGVFLPTMLPDAAWRRSFRRRLQSWYEGAARPLPWRRNRDPYAVWVSEVMLQQTQVATVVPYFERFLAALPSIGALAQADRQQVLRLWEGLGYYRRAVQLHEAAAVIVARHGGRFPRDRLNTLALPGVGRYTAGAVLSIAYDAREPILEANTTRLFSRLLGYTGPVHSTAGQRLLWAMAEAVLPAAGAGRFNQALMELGGQVCCVRGPRCDACPAATLCQANRRGLQEALPAAKPKPAITAVREVAVAVYRRGRVLLLERPAGQRWAGLWDFPRYPLSDQAAACQQRELLWAVRQQTGLDIRLLGRVATLKHSVTRFRITLDCYQAEYCGGRLAGGPAVMRWLRPDQLAEYPLSTTGRRLAGLIGSADNS